MSNHFLVLTALGPDRRGLVADVTTYVTSRGGNIEDSRMSVLGAEFGVMMLVSADADGATRLEADAEALAEDTGSSVLVRRTSSPKEHRRGETRPYEIVVESFDHAGILATIARPIKELGINVVSLETSAYEAPFSGTQLFRAEARIDVPRGVSVDGLREALNDAARAQDFDVTLTPVR